MTQAGRRRGRGRPQRVAQEAFQEAMADPRSAAGGATVFPATGQLGEPAPTVRPDDAGRPGGRDVRAGAVRQRDVHRGRFRAGLGRSPRRRSRPRSRPTTELVPGLDRDRGRRCRRSSASRSASRSRPRPSRSPILDAGAAQGDGPGQAGGGGKAILAPFGEVEVVRLARLGRDRPELREPGRPDVEHAVPVETPGPSAAPGRRRRDGPPAPAPVGRRHAVTRLLGIDLGERRIGLALADDDGSAARPLTTLRRGRDLDADAAAMPTVVEPGASTSSIVGLPLEASGERAAGGA